MDTVHRVKNFFTENERSHIWECSNRFSLSMGTVGKVLRKNLKWKTCNPHSVQVHSPANKSARKSACAFWLTFPEFKSDMNRRETVCVKSTFTIAKWPILGTSTPTWKWLNARKRTAEISWHGWALSTGVVFQWCCSMAQLLAMRIWIKY